MLLNCGVGEDSWESLRLQGDPTSPSQRRSVLGVHWKDWCWNWNSNTLAIWSKELTHWKRPWCWERLRVGGKGDDRRWDGWTALVTQGLNGHGFGWTLAVGDGRGGLACCGSWSQLQSWTRLSDWTELNWPNWDNQKCLQTFSKLRLRIPTLGLRLSVTFARNPFLAPSPSLIYLSSSVIAPISICNKNYWGIINYDY